jgi:excisionase family DNA binding protein
MIETAGMITVAEAAKRLNRSIEQVRRYLREGKLKGRRIGNQWFVDETSLNRGEKPEPLISKELVEEIRRLRELILVENGGQYFNIVEELRKDRESH